MLEAVNLILQCFLVFIKDCYCWKLLFVHEGPEIHWLQNVCYLRSNECVCLCASVHVCVFVCVCWEPLHVGLLGLYIFCHFLWDTLFQKMAVTIVSRKSIISNRSNFRFCRSSTIYFVRRNYSALREYVQCMSSPHDTWVNVHHWLTKQFKWLLEAQTLVDCTLLVYLHKCCCMSSFQEHGWKWCHFTYFS
jgi:hypothetical protein